MTTVGRIQRRRTAGWRAPEDAVYVGRGSKWGNPFVVGEFGTRDQCMDAYIYLAYGVICISGRASADAQTAAHEAMQMAATALAGKTLMCWCRADQRCHADVLLALANGQPLPAPSNKLQRIS